MKKILNTLFALAMLVLPASIFAQGQNSYTISTLSAALDTKASTFLVGSNSGMAPAANANIAVGGVTNLVKQLIMVDEELMEVQSTSGSTFVTVTRGFGGTLAVAHKSGANTYAGQPAWFIFGDKLGSCTAANEPILPVFSINRNSKQVRMYNCMSGVWVPQTVPATVTVSGAYTACNFGAGTILTSVGVSSSVAANTTEGLAEVFVPQTFYATGASVILGTTPDTATTRIYTLRTLDGKLLANTDTAGTAAGGTGSVLQQIAFTARKLISGPAYYLIGYSASGSDANGINLLTTAAPGQGVAGEITGLTYGTVPASVTGPTTFTSAKGPAGCVY